MRHMILASALAVILPQFTACASKSSKPLSTIDFADFDRSKVMARYCLQNTFTVVQTTDAKIWRNVNEVVLGPRSHSTRCQKRDLFYSGNKLAIEFEAGHKLTVQRDLDSDFEVPLKAFPNSKEPLYWYSDGTKTHFFVFLEEVERPGEPGIYIKYYMVEAFPESTLISECKRERPDNPEMLVELVGDATCPNPALPQLPPFVAAGTRGTRQTDVGGGGEGK